MHAEFGVCCLSTLGCGSKCQCSVRQNDALDCCAYFAPSWGYSCGGVPGRYLFLLHSLERPMLARMSWCNIHRRDVLSLRAVRIQSLRLERDDCSGSGALLHNGVPLG